MLHRILFQDYGIALIQEIHCRYRNIVLEGQLQVALSVRLIHINVLCFYDGRLCVNDNRQLPHG